MRWTDARWNRLLLLGSLVIAMACADGGEGCDAGCDFGLGGCGDEPGEPAPPAYIFPETGDILAQAVQVHVGQRGLDFISDTLAPLLLVDLLGEEGLSFCIPPIELDELIPGFGAISVCGGQFCDADETEPGCQLSLDLQEVDVLPTEPDTLRVALGVQVDESLPLLFGGDACTVNISADPLPITAEVRIAVDPRDGLTRISLPTDAIDFDLSLLEASVQGEGNCELANTAVPLLFGFIEDEFAGPIDELIGDQLCRTCHEFAPCPEGTFCIEGLCLDPATDACLGLDIELEGQLDLGGLLGDLLADLTGDIELALGYRAALSGFARATEVGPSAGLGLALEVGLEGPEPFCVAPRPRPSLEPVPPSTELAQRLSPGGNPFSLGLGISGRLLDLALWHIYNSGVLCQTIDASTLDVLTTGTLGLVLPSLAELTEGRDEPMSITLRANEAPRVELGSDPLLTLVVEDLALDLSLWFEQRWARLVTLETDLRIGIGLETSDDGAIVPLLDLEDILTNTRVRNPTLISPDEAALLEDVLPSLIGALLPSLLGDLDLDPIELPELLGLRIALPEDAFSAIESNTMLGLFADLELGMAALRTPVSRPELVWDVLSGAPSARGGVAALPQLRLRAETDFRGPAEISYRIGRSPWSAWQPGRELVLRDVRLLGARNGALALRVRPAGSRSAALRTQVALPAVLAVAPAQVRLREASEAIIIEAPADALVRWRVDEGSWTAWEAGLSRILRDELPAGEHALEVEVQNEMGERASAKRALRGGATDWRDATPPAMPAAGSGCAQGRGGSGSGAMLLLVGLVVVGLRSRRALVAGLLAAGLLLGGCSSDGAESLPFEECREDRDCPGTDICVDFECAPGPESSSEPGEPTDGATSTTQDPAPPAPACRVDVDCEEGEICREGRCRPWRFDTCAQDADCAPGELCRQGVCVEAPEAPCEDALDCAPGERCDEGVCVEDDTLCEEDADCETELCVGGRCAVPEGFCRRDLDCRTWESCEEARCEPTRCEADGEVIEDACPPGTWCVEGSCAPDTRCTSDLQCGAGRFCVEGVCADRQCETGDDCALDCPESGVPLCLAGACSCNAPCPQGCDDGTYCCYATNRCTPKPDACALTECPPGTAPRAAGAPVMDSVSCEADAPGPCECEALPALPVGEFGAFLAAASQGEHAFVAAYNETWGDLMIAPFAEDAADLAWQAVDGVPQDRMPTADPEGYRGGIAEAGPRAGRHVAMVVDREGRAHLAWQHEEAGALPELRYGRGEWREGAWTWTIFALETQGEPGLQTRMTLDGDDNPVIVWRNARFVEEGNEVTSALRMARALAAEPVSVDDFALTTLASAPVAAACGGPCPTGTRCETETNQCRQTVSLRWCGGACSEDEACFTGETGRLDAQCGGVSDPEAIPWPGVGPGHFPDVIFDDPRLLVVHYDADAGELRLLSVEEEAMTPIFAWPGSAWRGRLVRLESGEVGLLSADVSSSQLRWVDPFAGTESVQVLDSGERSEGGGLAFHEVGFEASALEDAGVLRVLYQDATAQALYEVSGEGGAFEAPRQVAAPEAFGAFGFALTQLFVEDRRFVVFREIGQDERVRALRILELER